MCYDHSCFWSFWLQHELISVKFTEHLGQQLEDYVATLPVSVKVLRTEKRSGLIRARLLGAKHVKGQVITFLDAHCECTEGWLEPLLARIALDRSVDDESTAIRSLWVPDIFGRGPKTMFSPNASCLRKVKLLFCDRRNHLRR